MRYQLQFQVPPAMFGQAEAANRLVTGIKQLQGIAQTGGGAGTAWVVDVTVLSGSAIGQAVIDAPSYEDALALVAQRTPQVLGLEWHLNEQADATKIAAILETASFAAR